MDMHSGSTFARADLGIVQGDGDRGAMCVTAGPMLAKLPGYEPGSRQLCAVPALPLFVIFVNNGDR